ncbi:MAG: ABC transporter permease subunit [Phycisphaerales bacterium]|nr:ABC transporter permease subunit [Phycisphaerales bacterium]
MSDNKVTTSQRQTLPSAIGEPMVWLTGGSLVLCLLMIILLLGMVVYNGSVSFWPRPIERVTLESGEVFLGLAMDQDVHAETLATRTLYRVGNRDIGQESFRWVDDQDIVESEYPSNAMLLEREAWGVWLGIPESIFTIDDEGNEVQIATGSDQVFEQFNKLHRDARDAGKAISKLKDQDLGKINREIESLRLEVQQSEIESHRSGDSLFRFNWGTWGFSGVLVAICVGFFIRVRHLGTEIGSIHARKGKLTRFSLIVSAFMLLGAMWIASPWGDKALDEQQLQELREQVVIREAELLSEYELKLGQIRAMEETNDRLRIVIREPTTGEFAPTSQTLSDEPLHMQQIVRAVESNQLSTADRVGVYLSRWWEYLSANPREANTEGGVFPVIVGTILLTLLLTIFVTPMGVIAALYLREYAKQGFVTSMIRIAVNNLAGVPSIVYGVFGLGFFCYTVGQYVDTGPKVSDRVNPGTWWMMYIFIGLVIVIGYAVNLWGKPDPGKLPSQFNLRMKRATWIVWFSVLVLGVLLITKTPYFHGLFEARAEDGTPTFGARGMLWASLTLALLTLPVVIVATEEAIAAVPNSMREGSYGCGASKWQTMRRIVLPGALPGILTGGILAMARGAGEVAPLMLVGAVKLNQDLPISTEAPFIHADRSFMHLGFHIYDLGFQSPDSQAARPLVWTTTLLFLAVVFALNFSAIMIRSRVRARMAGQTI